MGVLDFLKSESEILDEKQAKFSQLDTAFAELDSAYLELERKYPSGIPDDVKQGQEAIRIMLGESRKKLDKKVAATPKTRGVMSFLKDEGQKTLEDPGRVGRAAGEAIQGVSDAVPEPIKTAYDKGVVEPVMEIAGGVQQAAAGLARNLDAWASWLSSKTGIPKDGFLGKDALKVAEGEFTKQAEVFMQHGMDPDESAVASFLHHTYSGIGRAAFDLPIIMAQGLPIYSAVGGGAQAIEQGESVFKGTVVGGIEGLLLHGVLKSARFLPQPEKALLGVGVFGSPTAVEEMKKPKGERDYSLIVAEALIGGGLMLGKTAGISRKQLVKDLKGQYGKDFDALAEKFGQMADDKDLDTYAKGRGETIAKLSSTPQGAEFVKNMRPFETFDQARWRYLHEKINERGVDDALNREVAAGRAKAEADAQDEARAFMRRIAGQKIGRNVQKVELREQGKRDQENLIRLEREAQFDEAYLKQVGKENTRMNELDDQNVALMVKHQEFYDKMEVILKRAAIPKKVYEGAPQLVEPGKPDFLSEELGVERPTAEVLEHERQIEQIMARVNQVKKTYEGEVPIIGEKPKEAVKEEVTEEKPAEIEVIKDTTPTAKKTELVEEALTVARESKGKSGDESLTGQGYQLGIKARTDKALAEKIEKGISEVSDYVKSSKDFEASQAAQYFTEAKQAAETSKGFKQGVDKGEIDVKTGKIIKKESTVPEPIDAQMRKMKERGEKVDKFASENDGKVFTVPTTDDGKAVVHLDPEQKKWRVTWWNKFSDEPVVHNIYDSYKDAVQAVSLEGDLSKAEFGESKRLKTEKPIDVRFPQTPGEAWTDADPGALPGEPYFKLEKDKSIVITEVEAGGPNNRWAVAWGEDKFREFDTIGEAAKWGEKNADKLTDPKPFLPKKPRSTGKSFTSEDIELKPDARPGIERIAMLQDGKIYAYRLGEKDIFNHADISIKHKLGENAVPGFVNRKGEFLYQYEEDIAGKPQKSIAEAVKERAANLEAKGGKIIEKEPGKEFKPVKKAPETDVEKMDFKQLTDLAGSGLVPESNKRMAKENIVRVHDNIYKKYIKGAESNWRWESPGVSKLVKDESTIRNLEQILKTNQEKYGEKPTAESKVKMGDRVLYKGEPWEVGFVNEIHHKGTVRLQKSGESGAKQLNYIPMKDLVKAGSKKVIDLTKEKKPGKEPENIRQAVKGLGKIRSADLAEHGISIKEDRNLFMQIGTKDGKALDDLAQTLIKSKDNPEGILAPAPGNMNPTDWLIENIRKNTKLGEEKLTEKKYDEDFLDFQYNEMGVSTISKKKFAELMDANKDPENISTDKLNKGDKFTIAGEEFEVTKDKGDRLEVEDGEVYNLDRTFDFITIDKGSLTKKGEKKKLPKHLQEIADREKQKEPAVKITDVTPEGFGPEKPAHVMSLEEFRKEVVKDKGMLRFRGELLPLSDFEMKNLSDPIEAAHDRLIFEARKGEKPIDNLQEKLGLTQEAYRKLLMLQSGKRGQTTADYLKEEEMQPLRDLEKAGLVETEPYDKSGYQTFKLTDYGRDPEKAPREKPKEKPAGKESLVDKYIKSEKIEGGGSWEASALSNYAHRFIGHLERKLKVQPWVDPEKYLLKSESPYAKLSGGGKGEMFRDLEKLVEKGVVEKMYTTEQKNVYGLKGDVPADYLRPSLLTVEQAEKAWGKVEKERPKVETPQETYEQEFREKKAAEGVKVDKASEEAQREARDKRIKEGGDLFDEAEKKKQETLFRDSSGEVAHGRVIKSDMEMTPRIKNTEAPNSDLGDPIRLRDISLEMAMNLSKEMSKDVRIGLIKRFAKKAKGLYFPDSGIIRLNNINDLTTFAHEFGHELDMGIFGIEGKFKYNKSDFVINTSFGLKDKKRREKRLASLRQKYGDELVDSLYERYLIRKELSGFLEAIQYPSKKHSEAIAEFVDKYVTDPELVLKLTPKFYNLFESIIDYQPNIRESLLTARRQFKEYKSQDPRLLILGTLAKEAEPSNFLNTLKTTKEGFYGNVIDGTQPFRELEKKLQVKDPSISGSRNPLLQVLSYLGVEGKAEQFLNYKPFSRVGDSIKFHDIKPLLGNRKSPGIIHNLIKDGNINHFEGYLIAKHNQDLAKAGHSSSATADMATSKKAAELFEQQYPQFKEMAEVDLTKYQNSLLDYYQQSGKLSKEGADLMKEKYPYYVPMKRFFAEWEETGNFPNVGKALKDYSLSPVKALKGSEREVVSPLGSIIKNTYDLIAAADQNYALRSIVEGLKAIDSRLVQEIPKKMVKPVRVFPTTDPLTGETPEGMELRFTVTYDKPKNAEIISVWNDGEVSYYQVPKRHYDAFFALNEPVARWVRLAAKPAQLLRAGAVVYDPTFAVRNVPRDQISAWFYTKFGYNPFYHITKGFMDTVGKTETYQKFLASGADMSFLTAIDREMSKGYIEKKAGRKIQTKWQEYRSNPLYILQDVNRLSELGTRVGSFRNAYKKSGGDIYKAMQESREISGDYGVKGKAMRGVAAIYPFFNARIQHAKLMNQSAIRRGTAAFVARALPITGIAIANWLNNTQGDDQTRKLYYELPSWRRIGMFNFKIPYTDSFWSIPRGPLGILFGATTEYALDKMTEQDAELPQVLAEEFFKDYLPMSNYIDMIPQAGRPIVEQFANKVGYTGKPIVRTSLKGLEPAEQYEEWTSEIMKFLGKQTNISPVRLQHVFTGYTAGTGRAFLNITDDLLEAAGFTEPSGEDLFQKMSQWPITKAFLSRPPLGTRGRSVQKFYRKLDSMEEINRTVNNFIKSESTSKIQSYLDDEERARQYKYYIDNKRSIGRFREVLRVGQYLRGELAKGDYPGRKGKIRTIEEAMTNIAIRFNDAFEDNKNFEIDDVMSTLYQFGRQERGEEMGIRKQLTGEFRSSKQLQDAMNRLNLYKLRERAGTLPAIDKYRMESLDKKLKKYNEQTQ